MTCTRCGGLAIHDDFYGPTEHFAWQCHGLRCLNCGSVRDVPAQQSTSAPRPSQNQRKDRASTSAVQGEHSPALTGLHEGTYGLSAKRVLSHISVHMNVDSDTSGSVVIVTSQGRLDTNNAPEVQQVLTDHIERGERKIVLDLSCIEYMSSIGLRVILKTAMAMTRNGGQMALCGGNDQVREVLHLSGAMVMSLHAPAREDALAKIQA